MLIHGNAWQNNLKTSGEPLMPISCALLAFGSSVVVLCHTIALAQDSTININLARQYFEEAKSTSHRDNARLWGTTLYGPMLFVDPAKRDVVANEQARDGHLAFRDGVWLGKLPQKENIANTATTWAGTKWTMIIWPLPQDHSQRVRLMMHELFHRIQDEIGLPGSNPTNSHLDTREGRIWLQLEWRALEAALRTSGTSRRQALEDALLFCRYRREIFKAVDSTENALELNEGLAEYTGMKLACASDSQYVSFAVRSIIQAPSRPTFVRSFAYVSGPAYGFLLDAAGLPWRKMVSHEKDLGSLLQTAFSITLPGDLKRAADERATVYGGDTLRAKEVEREQTRLKLIAGYRAQLVEGPTLQLPLTGKFQYSFDPNTLVPLDDARTVYPTLRVSDEWGILDVANGALMVREKGIVGKVFVSAPKDTSIRPLISEGWTLQLNPAWSLIAGVRKGDYVIQKSR
jgi:hypothetical protein